MITCNQVGKKGELDLIFVIRVQITKACSKQFSVIESLEFVTISTTLPLQIRLPIGQYQPSVASHWLRCLQMFRDIFYHM